MNDIKEQVFEKLITNKKIAVEELDYYITKYKQLDYYHINSIIRLLKEIQQIDNTMKIVEKYITDECPSNKT